MAQLNLLKSRLGVGFDSTSDKQTQQVWEKMDVFNAVNGEFAQHGAQDYTLLDGPPYANGAAHLGHALNKTLKDLVLKSRWFLGYHTSYTPGWDCHGLPLELVVEKKYGRLAPEQLEKKCKNLALKTVARHKRDFKSLGVMAQWDKPYLTLSPQMRQQNWATLKKLFDKDLLEYKKYPVHYCPKCASSLASAELEEKEVQKHSLYFKMRVETKLGEVMALVWTTTPWTLPMNQGLAYRDEFEYEVWKSELDTLVLQNPQLVQDYLNENGYAFSSVVTGKDLGLNASYTPLEYEKAGCYNAAFVESGATGFVHMASAHGPEDFELCQKENLEVKARLNKYGVYEFNSSSSLYSELNGVSFANASKAVLGLMGQDNSLVKYEASLGEKNVCWRHKTEVYYNACSQLFLDLTKPGNNLFERVKELLKSSNELNPVALDRLDYMLKTRPSWCLSRQRKWGCELRVLVDKSTNELSPKTSEYLELLALGQSEEAAQFLNQNADVEPLLDVLDVWFDSGNVANALMHGHKTADMVLEGKDQYRGWFQSLAWLSAGANDELAFKDVLCHGFVLNQNKEKLAKSSGNSQSVETYLKKYGADTLRLWSAAQEVGPDAVFSDVKMKEMQKFYSRLRLSLRFLSSNVYDYEYSKHSEHYESLLASDNPMDDLHRFELVKAQELEDRVKNHLKKYDFKSCVFELYDYCDNTLSSNYFEYLKNSLYLEAPKSPARVMGQAGACTVLLKLLKMVSVFCPFLAEEVYQDLRKESEYKDSLKASVFLEMTKLELGSPESSVDVKYPWDKYFELRQNFLAQLEPYQRQNMVKSRQEAGAVLKGAKTLEFFDNVFLTEKDKKYFLGLSAVNFNDNDNSLNSVMMLESNSEGAEESAGVKYQKLKDNGWSKCDRCWFYFKSTNLPSLEEKACLCPDCVKQEAQF